MAFGGMVLSWVTVMPIELFKYDKFTSILFRLLPNLVYLLVIFSKLWF